MAFRKHYLKYVVIIDCFKVFIDLPTDLSDVFIKHNTVKYLIGIIVSVSYSKVGG